MRCSQAREALSAWSDRESHPAPRQEVHAHVAGCAQCSAYDEELGALRSRTESARATSSPPDLSDAILATRPATPTTPTPRPASAGSRATLLRWGVASMAAAELVLLGVEFWSHRGTVDAEHATHESMSFTVAVCVGLFCTAIRPALSRGTLPIVGVAVVLLMSSAGVDLALGRTGVLEEAPHLDLLAAFVLLWLLSRTPPARPGAPPSPPQPRPGPGQPVVVPRRPGLRLVTRSPIRLVGVGAVTLLVALGIALVPAVAEAHAVLEQSNPTPDSLVGRLPAQVSLRFDEAVTVLPTSLRIYGPDGSRVDDGPLSRPDGDGSQISVPVSSRQVGTYLVSWRVVSADSHPVSGAFTFSVRQVSHAPVAAVAGTDPTVAAFLGAARWVGYLSVAVLIGGVVFLRRCWPGGSALRWPRRLVTGSLGLAAVATVGLVVIKGPYDAALGPSHLWDLSLAREVLDTTYGRACLVRLLLLATAGALLRLRPAARFGDLTRALVAVGIAVSFSYGGHAAASHPRVLALSVDAVHLLAMSVWVGGLIVLVVLLFRVSSGDPEPEEVVHAVGRFSPLAAWAVIALVLTGTYQSWRQVGSWAAFPHTTYGRELLVKLGLVALTLLAAAFSRAWVLRERHPTLLVQAATGTAIDESTRLPAPSLTRLRGSVLLETAGVIAVLGVTSALVTAAPARTAYHPSVSARLTLGRDTVQVTAVTAGDRQMGLRLHISGPHQEPTDPAQLSVVLGLPSQGITALPVTLAYLAPGSWRGNIAVPLAGDWQLSITVRTTEIDEYTGTTSLPIG